MARITSHFGYPKVEASLLSLRLSNRVRATFPWAVWYSALAPTGEFEKAPLNYIRFGIGARIAKTMIEAINLVDRYPPISSSNCGSSSCEWTITSIATSCRHKTV